MLAFDQHSGFASIYPSAAMYLVQALASLRDLDMNIRIEGFYDAMIEPTADDLKLLGKIDAEADDRKRLVGYERLIRDPSPDRVVEQLLFTPTCNIAGITTGYQGPGSKTVLAAEATAKLDFRLIPDQEPADIQAKLRRHFDSNGFDKVEILWADGEKPVRSDPSSAIGKATADCVRELHGEPVIWPFMQATGPMHPVVADLGIPAVMPVGVGRPDNRIHAPNENIRIDDYLNTVRLMCRLWERFGAG
jgi:acetylornithine deacetylase/succinyl-diaminopimelate desuccinylase-like protein